MGPSPDQMSQLESMIRRDPQPPKRHPLVARQRGVGDRGQHQGRAHHRLDAGVRPPARPTRRTTVANSGGWGGTSTVIDLVGYNYINQSNPDEQHAKFPHQPGVGTEEASTPAPAESMSTTRRAPTWRSRRGEAGGNCEKGWKYYAARPSSPACSSGPGSTIAANRMPYDWPEIDAQFGFLDGCGFEKDTAYYLKSWWTDEPVLHLFPHWNWAGREGQPIDVSASAITRRSSCS